MEYKKIDLTEPIYELQKNETPKQHYFLILYFQVEDDNLTNFYKSFEGLKKGDKWGYSGCEKTLEFTPYAQSTFRNLVYCLQYRLRRKAFWNDTFGSTRDSIKKKVFNNMGSMADDLIESNTNLKKTEDEIDKDNARPHLKASGKRDISTSRKNNWDTLKDMAGIEDPTKTVKVDSDTTIEYKGVNNLLEAFYVSKAEWDKRKQQQ